MSPQLPTRRRSEGLNTRDPSYTARLVATQSAWWKRWFDVQAPYRWNLRRLNLGFTLDIGCGIGRNLVNLSGHGVGVDHNEDFVEIAKARGLSVFTPEQFRATAFNAVDRFESILFAHVAEHMTEQQAAKLLSDYLQLLKPQGQVILIAPQEAGYRSDPTHVQFMDFDALRRIACEVGLTHVREYSFPFVRLVGRCFRYNEFVSISKKAPK
jgi:SAM-dependent methyltransferase